MSLEELLVPAVRHAGRVGELRASREEILFVHGESEPARRDYAPAYTERSEERALGIELSRVDAVERDGATVRIRADGSEEEFAFAREPDAESFERLVAARLGA